MHSQWERGSALPGPAGRQDPPAGEGEDHQSALSLCPRAGQEGEEVIQPQPAPGQLRPAQELRLQLLPLPPSRAQSHSWAGFRDRVLDLKGEACLS